MSELAKKLSKIAPMLQISARVDSYGGPGEDADYMKERHTRLKKEIKVAEEQVKNWDAEAIAAQALKSLKADLASKKAQKLECESQMDLNKPAKKAKSEDGYEDMEDDEKEE